MTRDVLPRTLFLFPMTNQQQTMFNTASEISNESLTAGLVGFYLMRRWDDIDASENAKARAFVPDLIKSLTVELLAKNENPSEMNVVRFIDNHDELLDSVDA